MNDGDTISALITAPGSGAVAVVRISGAGAAKLVHTILPHPEQVLGAPRRVVYSAVLDPEKQSPLDHALITFFPAPHSFTGEDVIEFALHGSPYLVRRFQEIVATLGVRGARPGEFTERAFHNGKMDLTQAEAVADLIAAETETQARVAREQLEGRLSSALSELGEPLRDLLAQIEAGIDFPEEDINPDEMARWVEVLRDTRANISRYIDSYRTGRICRDGAQVVLAGLPNAGKSSLLNRIIGDERAIVTPIAGTTRDSIEERIVLDGLYLRLWDTAGLAQEGYHPDQVERIGIEHSWKRIRHADLVLYVLDSSREVYKELPIIREVATKAQRLLIVGNKNDLPPGRGYETESSAETHKIEGIRVWGVSAQQGAGISELKQAIVAELVDDQQLSRGSVLICSERHRNALVAADELLRETLSSISQGSPAEVIAQQLRSALYALNEIIGVTSPDEILGRIFSKFCIGK